jgi:hypothetical protein
LDLEPEILKQIYKKARGKRARLIFLFLFFFVRHGSRSPHDAPSTKNVFFVDVKQTALFASHYLSTGLEVNVVYSERRAAFYTLFGCHF